MAVHTTVKLVLASDVRLIDVAHAAAERVAAVAGLDDDPALNLGIAVREAVINAMTHGNGRDVARDVVLVFSVGPREIEIRVTDQGQGFDPTMLPDPTDPENLLRTSGRGLLLIRAFCDAVDFLRHDGRGMEVVLHKRLDLHGSAPAAAP